MKVFLNDSFVSPDEATISPDDRGFLLADGVYEVIRTYEGRLFETDAHLARLQRSLGELRIELPDLGRIEEVARTLLMENGHEAIDALVYIQVTRGVAPRRHAFPDAGTTPTLFINSSPFPIPLEEQEEGIRVILTRDLRWARCDIKSIALLPNVLASQEAREKGASEAIFIRDGVVTEGAHTNVAAVLNGDLVTHPLDTRVLPGVTRGFVLELCRKVGVPVVEAPIRKEALKVASELMVFSTTAEVTPVVRVDDREVAGGEPGPVTRSLQRAFRDEVQQFLALP